MAVRQQVVSQEIIEFVSKPLFDERVILNKDPAWPKISVVTPSYNQAQFLEKTILSVLNQNYPNLEYIIIDGGSSDGSTEIIKKYEKYLAYWVSEKDKGMYEAINKGLKIATGDILAYLNSDDLYNPDTLKIIAQYLTRNSETMAIYSDCEMIDKNDNFLYIYHFPKFKFSNYIALNWSYIPQPTTFWRRIINEKLGNFDVSFKMAGDYEFFARIGKHFKIDKLDLNLSKFRLHNSSLTSTHKNINRDEVLRIHNMYGVKRDIFTEIRRICMEIQIKLSNIAVYLKKFRFLYRRRAEK